MKKQKFPDWSECGQVFFCDGYGWGLTEALQTICLGKETEINKYFETRELSKELGSIQRQVLTGILDYRKELLNEQPKSDHKRRSSIGSRPAGIIKHRTANLKSASPKKRTALHKTK